MPSFSVSGLSLVVQQMLPEPHAGLLIGLLFGTKTTLTPDFYSALVTTGVLHIIALSGMNITIIMDGIATSFQWWVGKRWASVISIVTVAWFVWFVGPSSTIVRAAIMGSLSLIAVLFGRQYWALFGWALAVVIMLLVHVAWVFEVSFQLSTLATLGIILFGKSHVPSGSTPRAGSFVQHVTALMYENVHLTLSAQVFTIPLILFHFHRVSLIAPLTNLAIAWVVPPLTMMGWCTAIMGWIFLPIGHVFAWIDWVLLEYMIRVVQVASMVPLASIWW